jgi:molecular chaperone HtpG
MTENKKISLDDYLEKAEDKKTIYYITGKSESEVLASPYLAQFKENNVDVLLLTDHIDSFIVQTLTEYK